MLVTWRQQERRAPCQEHVPDAVGVIIVVTGHHGGVDGNGHRGHGDARKEVEDPALPGSRVAVAPVPTAVYLERIIMTALAQGLQLELRGAHQTLGSMTMDVRYLEETQGHRDLTGPQARALA